MATFHKTREARTQLGSVFAFDLEGAIPDRSTFWWNPLRTARGAAAAARISHELTKGFRRTRRQYHNATLIQLADAMRHLILAAINKDETLLKVQEWAATQSEEPVRILADSGSNTQAKLLGSLLKTPHDHRGTIFEGLDDHLQEVLDDTAAACVAASARNKPGDPPAKPEFTPWQLFDADSHGIASLYIITSRADSPENLLISMLTVELTAFAIMYARLMGGKIYPPLSIASPRLPRMMKSHEIGIIPQI
ncbi:hypothetical protein [Amycolatopsis sp. GM8]|uniref:hypothetical protein n=1 Tax=Amycolatopsis sp. GM8 TaxID=2896530 RepID=UPI001F3776B8|nr:hypothetical protein [Amycolatopsis sp. GM8]